MAVCLHARAREEFLEGPSSAGETKDCSVSRISKFDALGMRRAAPLVNFVKRHVTGYRERRER